MASNRAAQFDSSSIAIIRIRSCQLTRRSNLNRQDREDIAQDLALDLVKRLRRFDPNKGKRGAFSYLVIERATADQLRRLQSLKWRSRSRPAELIDSVATDPSADLRIDLEMALSHLPPNLQAVARELMMSNSIARAARELGVSRTTVYSRIDAIPQCFAERGLRDYLA